MLERSCEILKAVCRNLIVLVGFLASILTILYFLHPLLFNDLIDIIKEAFSSKYFSIFILSIFSFFILIHFKYILNFANLKKFLDKHRSFKIEVDLRMILRTIPHFVKNEEKIHYRQF